MDNTVDKLRQALKIAKVTVVEMDVQTEDYTLLEKTDILVEKPATSMLEELNQIVAPHPEGKRQEVLKYLK